MARSGVSRKENKHGRTPNTGGDWKDVVDEPYTGESPDLPRRPRGKKWHPMVESWWALVRKMPHCVLWMDTDWQYAVELAFLKCAYWEMFDAGEATAAQATEIRRREDQLGTTAEARRKLLIRYVDPEPEVPDEEPERDLVVTEEEQVSAEHSATVTPLADRRARLTRKTG
jgi:hypothetical protein